MEKPFKIVMLDDEADVQEYLAEIVTDAGYEVICLPNGDTLADVLNEHQDGVCLIVSDFRMPGKNGLELREQIKEDFDGIPFIILSSVVSRAMLEMALELNIAAFIDKPVSPEDLVAAIEKYSKDRKNHLEEKAFLKKIFIEEATELVSELEPLILELEQNPDEIDEVNSIFRLVHTIKGGSGVLDQPDVTAYLHSYEDLLGKLKNGGLKATADVASVLLQGFDELSEIVSHMGGEERYPIDLPYWQDQFSLKGVDSTAPRSTVGSAAKSGKPKAAPEKKPKEQENIKVPTGILNDFMELSGEITVIKNTVNKLVLAIKKELQGSADLRLLAEMIEEMNKINSSMQTKITEIRKLPLQNIFRTFARVARDIASKGDKEIDLSISGEQLRVDTTLHQVLSNSLIHIIRNACDHGIEPKADRLKADKPEHGTIRLEASETGDFIQILVKDDGRGIDAKKVKDSALTKNLYTAEQLAAMSDSQAYQIIFEPGFSTASQITDVSGRGVGMDMVKTSVESVGGKIFIESTLGEGSAFTFRLPIPRSVLIIKSLAVESCGQPYFICQDGISRIIKVDQSNRAKLLREVSGSQVIATSEQLLPLVNLSDILADGSPSQAPKEFHVLIVQGEDFRYGIAVDRIIDSEEVVVKPLAPYLKKLGIYLGATFLADGGIGIVLDVAGIAKKYGIEKLNQQEAMDMVKHRVSSEAEVERDHLLVVSLFCEGVFAFDLASVFRLEQIAADKLRHIAGHSTYIYRGKATEVVDLTRQLGLNDDYDYLAKPLIQAVVVKRDDRYVAFVIDTIQEIVEKNPKTYQPEAEQGFVAGHQVDEDKLICVFDCEAILDEIAPKVPEEDGEHKGKVHTLPQPERGLGEQVPNLAGQQPESSQSTNCGEEDSGIDMAAGWGEF